MPTEAIDPPGIDWLRVSPKYVTVRLAGWALGTLVAVALLSLPLILVLTGGWTWLPGLAGRRPARGSAAAGPVAARADSPAGALDRLRRA